MTNKEKEDQTIVGLAVNLIRWLVCFGLVLFAAYQLGQHEIKIRILENQVQQLTQEQKK